MNFSYQLTKFHGVQICWHFLISILQVLWQILSSRIDEKLTNVSAKFGEHGRYGIPQPAPAPGDRRRAAAPRASALELLAAAREMQGRGVAMRQQIDLGGAFSCEEKNWLVAAV